MGNMKILYVLSGLSLRSGGPSRSVPLMAKGLSEVGVDVTILTFKSSDMNIDALDGTSITLKILEKKTCASVIEKYILENNFDLIHLQSIWEICYHTVARIAQKHNIPYVVSPRGMLDKWSLAHKKWKKKLAWWLYQRRDVKRARCICTSSINEAANVRNLGIDVPIEILPNGIETAGYTCRQSIASIKKHVLYLGRLHRQKGIDLLIDAWNNIVKSGYMNDWQLIIVGNGEEAYISSLKQRLSTLNIESSTEIRPPAFGDAKIALYKESALYCLPSYSESFGMSIAEAMSCGVPVITTTNCPWEFLNETKTGWCVELSVENLEKSLREAMSMNPTELYDMGQKASKLIYENFDYRNVTRKTFKLYEWLLNGGEKPEFIYE